MKPSKSSPWGEDLGEGGPPSRASGKLSINPCRSVVEKRFSLWNLEFLWNLKLGIWIFRIFRPKSMEMNASWPHLCTLATGEIEAILARLPADLRETAASLPVTFEPYPNAGLQADGIEPDTLGLFIGPDFAEEGHSPMPPQIILFLENLWDMAEGDEPAFLDEVNTTFLHELGHFLGLDEDDLTRRGLE